MRYEGYVPETELPIRPGHRVLIPKGVKIRSTHPQRGTYISGRNMTVTIHHILPGTSHYSNPKVVWAGSSGYWCEVDINDVI